MVFRQPPEHSGIAQPGATLKIIMTKSPDDGWQAHAPIAIEDLEAIFDGAARRHYALPPHFHQIRP